MEQACRPVRQPSGLYNGFLGIVLLLVAVSLLRITRCTAQRYCFSASSWLPPLMGRMFLFSAAKACWSNKVCSAFLAAAAAVLAVWKKSMLSPRKSPIPHRRNLWKLLPRQKCWTWSVPAVFVRLGKCQPRLPRLVWYLLFDIRHDEPVRHLRLSENLCRPQHHHHLSVGPTIQPHLDMLLDMLLRKYYFLCIETNGLNPAPPQIDYVATSPKACYAAKYEKSCIETADEVRIVADGDVLAFCENMERKIRAHHYYLSPLEQDCAMNIYDTIRQIGILNSRPDASVHWQLSVQTHKWAGIEKFAQVTQRTAYGFTDVWHTGKCAASAWNCLRFPPPNQDGALLNKMLLLGTSSAS